MPVARLITKNLTLVGTAEAFDKCVTVILTAFRTDANYVLATGASNSQSTCKLRLVKIPVQLPVCNLIHTLKTCIA